MPESESRLDSETSTWILEELGSKILSNSLISFVIFSLSASISMISACPQNTTQDVRNQGCAGVSFSAGHRPPLPERRQKPDHSRPWAEARRGSPGPRPRRHRARRTAALHGGRAPPAWKAGPLRSRCTPSAWHVTASHAEPNQHSLRPEPSFGSTGRGSRTGVDNWQGTRSEDKATARSMPKGHSEAGAPGRAPAPAGAPHSGAAPAPWVTRRLGRKPARPAVSSGGQRAARTPP